MDLREKIIKLALAIRPAPAIPEKDRVLELVGEAKGALKTASTQADYSDAAKLLQKALLLAPWDADLNFNMAKAQELASREQGQIRFHLFRTNKLVGARFGLEVFDRDVSCFPILHFFLFAEEVSPVRGLPEGPLIARNGGGLSRREPYPVLPSRRQEVVFEIIP